MTSPDRCPTPLSFDVSDPYVVHTYSGMLDILLDEDQSNVPARMRELEETSSHIVGRQTARQIAARVIVDEIDISNPRPEMLGSPNWHS